jgi:hypothetical protein
MEGRKLRSAPKVEAEQLTSTNNSKNIPINATIRQEYIKCGKLGCTSKRGPYYYTYWKENRRLRKKYIGKYSPSRLEPNQVRCDSMNVSK